MTSVLPPRTYGPKPPLNANEKKTQAKASFRASQSQVRSTLNKEDKSTTPTPNLPRSPPSQAKNVSGKTSAGLSPPATPELVLRRKELERKAERARFERLSNLKAEGVQMEEEEVVEEEEEPMDSSEEEAEEVARELERESRESAEAAAESGGDCEQQLSSAQDEDQLNKKLKKPVKAGERKRKREQLKQEKEEKEKKEIAQWLSENGKTLKRIKKGKDSNSGEYAIEDLNPLIKSLTKEYKKTYPDREAVVRLTYLLPLFHFCNKPVLKFNRIESFDYIWKAKTEVGQDRIVEMAKHGDCHSSLLEVMKQRYSKNWWKIRLNTYQKKYCEKHRGPFSVTLTDVEIPRDEMGLLEATPVTALEGSPLSVPETDKPVAIIWLCPIVRVQCMECDA